MYRLCSIPLLALILAEVGGGSAAAQTAAQSSALGSVVGEARSAYGYRSGDESIGLYDDRKVRGFALEAAGNYRIGGYYFARSGGTNSPLMRRTDVMVGLSATDTSFPGPSGLIDHQIREPGATSNSLTLTLDTYLRPRMEVLAAAKTPDARLGVAGVLILAPDENDFQGGDGRSYLVGLTPRATLAEGHVLQLLGVEFGYERSGSVRFSPAGREAPSGVERERYLGQPWAQEKGRARLGGAIYEGDLSPELKAAAAVFHSASLPDAAFTHFYAEIDAAGDSRARVVAAPEQSTVSNSGELRLTWRSDWSFGQHEMLVTARGRQTRAKLGGEQVIDLGPANVQVGAPDVPRPQLTGQARDRNNVDQWGLGASYGLKLASGQSLRLGALRADYQTTSQRQGLLSEAGSQEWLYNASLSAPVGDRLTVYGSISRGMEEGGVAPASATNRNTILPPILSDQAEVGLRWDTGRQMRLYVTAFNIEKPAAAIDPITGAYGLSGKVRHRGLEASLTGQPMPGLNILMGGYVMDPTVSGPRVEAGLQASEPVGTPKWRWIGGVDYRLSQAPDLSVDARLEINDKTLGRTAASRPLELDGSAVVDLGFRYRFKAAERTFTLRGQLLNVFDDFSWQANASETLVYSEPRRYRLALSTSF